MLIELLSEIGVVVAYAAVGLVLMLAGYATMAAITPGKLSDLLWRDRSRNAAILVSSNLLAVAIIVIAAIATSADALGPGLITTVVFGVLGIALMALSFFLIDALTPGALGEVVRMSEIYPAIWVNACAHLGIAGIMAAALV